MLLKIFTVYDLKAEAYMQPFFMSTRGAAIRAFSDAISTGEHEFCKHPEDYILYEIGEFNDQSSQIESYDPPHLIGKALEFVIVRP